MTYWTTDITIVRIDETDLGLTVTATTAHTGRIVQCYLAGELVCWQSPSDGRVQFFLPQAGPDDPILLLAVEVGDERTDYFQDAFVGSARCGNRLTVTLRRDLLDGRAPTDKWRIFRGIAGASLADMLIHKAPVFPAGQGATGWGFSWGDGGWGLSGSGAPGWGVTWGWTWGFGIDHLTYVSDPLDRGLYPIRVEIIDAHGNVSPAFEAVAGIDGYAAPADDLAVASYDPTTGTLVLSMTSSKDI